MRVLSLGIGFLKDVHNRMKYTEKEGRQFK
jgi:hypothetical protein